MNQGLTKYWFIVYILAALLVLAGLLNLGIHLGPKVEAYLLQKFIPAEWHSTAQDLTHRLYVEELTTLTVTTSFGLGIISIGLLLFPLKEKLSHTYEREHFPHLKAHSSPSLWRQGLEELKLASLYLILQSLSLYLIIQGKPHWATLGSALSIGYLILAMTLDHTAPIFHRRGGQIHRILWILIRHAPLRSLLIGTACIGPVIILEKNLPPHLPATLSITLLVVTEVLGMAIATILGCHLGAKLIEKKPTLAEEPAPKPWTLSYRIITLTLTIWMAIFYAWWTKGALTHAPLIRAKYRIQPTKTTVQIRDTNVHLSIPVEITNRTTTTIAPTELHFQYQHPDHPKTEATLTGPTILGGQSDTLALEIALPLTEETLLNPQKAISDDGSISLQINPPLSKKLTIQIFPQ